MSTEIDTNDAPPAPLFELDMGGNGGVFAPSTYDEIVVWIQQERGFWEWVAQSGNVGNHKSLIDAPLASISRALQAANELRAYANDINAVRHRLEIVQRELRMTYVDAGFPHSSSPGGIKAGKLGQRSAEEAIGYMYAFIPSTIAFDGRSPLAWRGLIEGLSDRFGFSAVPKESYDAALQSASDLREKLERELGDKKRAIGVMQRKFEALDKKIQATEAAQSEEFNKLVQQSKQEHEAALKAHEEEMSALQAAFKENMTLRAPVAYWEEQRKSHTELAAKMGLAVAVSMGCLTFLLGVIVVWVLNTKKAGSSPEAWRVAVLGLIGVLGIWAVRLIVRLFLSHRHLSHDASERVTMVQTYLALYEGKTAPTEDDRKIVLGALFRPATDGIVKDEPIPNPALDVLTKLK